MINESWDILSGLQQQITERFIRHLRASSSGSGAWGAATAASAGAPTGPFGFESPQGHASGEVGGVFFAVGIPVLRVLNGYGSKMRTKNGTLVNGTKD